MHPEVPNGRMSDGMADLLLRLGRPGSRLRRDATGVLLETNVAGSVSRVGAAVLQEAEVAGYLEWARPASKMDKGALSALGRQTLRRHLITEAGLVQRVGSSRRRNSDADVAGLAERAAAAHPRENRSVIDQLAKRRDAAGGLLFTDTQIAAARRFAADFELGGLQPRVTARWSPIGVARQRRRSAPDALPDPAPSASAAQQRVRGALAALAGTFGNLVIDVCGFDRGLEAIEAERGWPRRTGRFMLAGALDQLALHYGLTLCPRPGSGEILQWGDGEHRPDRPKPRLR